MDIMSSPLLKDLKEVIYLMNQRIKNKNSLVNVAKQKVSEYTITNACEYFKQKEVLVPQIFFKFVHTLLYYLKKYRNKSDTDVRIHFYKTIKSNITKNSEIYKNQNKHANIIKFVRLIIWEIAKILMDPQVTLLYIDKNNDLEQLQKQDSNSKKALIFVNLLNQVSFTDFMPLLIQQVTSEVIEDDDFIEGDDVIEGNWGIQAAFLICIAAFSKIPGIQQQKSIVSIIYQGISKKNPKVRYYAIHALSCFINEANSKKYYDQFIPVIIEGLKQTTEYLACQWLKCFKSLIDNFDEKNYLVQNFDFIKERILFFITNYKGNKIIEHSLDCLVILDEISRLFQSQKRIQYFSQCNAVINFVLKSNQSVRNKAIKSQFQIISHFRYHKQIQQHVDNAIDTLHLYMQQIQTDTLLTCWNFLCVAEIKISKQALIFSKIFIIAIEYCNQSQFSKRSLAYLTFKYTSRYFQIKFGDYFIPTLKMIVPCLKNAVINRKADQVEQICAALDAIISSQRPKPNFSEYIHRIKKQTNKMVESTFSSIFLNQIIAILEYFSKLFLKWSYVAENQIKESLLFTFKVVIQHYGEILPQECLQRLLNKFWSTVYIFNSLKNFKNLVENQIKESSLQESQNQNSKTESSFLNEDEQNSFKRCRIYLPLILGSMIEHIHVKQDQILEKTILQIQQEIQFCKDHYDLICVTRYLTSIQQIPYQPINSQIISFFKKNCTNPYPSLRTQILYAICIIASNTPFTQDFKIKFDDWIKIIDQCKNVPKNQFDHDEDFGTCRDNYTCAIGHIVHKFRKYLNLTHLYDDWLDNLPLKYDKEQFKTQIDFLTNIVNSEDHQEPSDIKVTTRVSKILRIFSEVKCHIEREPNIRQNRDTLQKVKSAVKKILEWPIFKEHSVQILDFLSQEESAHLEELMKRQY